MGAQFAGRAEWHANKRRRFATRQEYLILLACPVSRAVGVHFKGKVCLPGRWRAHKRRTAAFLHFQRPNLQRAHNAPQLCRPAPLESTYSATCVPARHLIQWSATRQTATTSFKIAVCH